MAQRYAAQIARERMASGACPECGAIPSEHSADLRFWIPRGCDLTRDGVLDRIAQFKADLSAAQEA